MLHLDPSPALRTALTTHTHMVTRDIILTTRGDTTATELRTLLSLGQPADPQVRYTLHLG